MESQNKWVVIAWLSLFVGIIACGWQLFSERDDEVEQVVAQQRYFFDAQTSYDNHQFIGESLHIQSEDEFQTYELLEASSGERYVFVNEMSDSGILLATIAPGNYLIIVDEAQLVSPEVFSQTWHTIQRQQRANKVTLTSSGEAVYLLVEGVDKLPADVYDVVIDAGHGGVDTGASGYGLLESEEMLKFSLVLVEHLEALGLKVKLTRADEHDPAGDDVSMEEAPFVANGRITQVYETQAKLFISNHLNATEFALASGFQIYSSITASNTLAQTISTSLIASGMEASNITDVSALGDGTFKNWDVCLERISDKSNCRQEHEDYYYAIRESGGSVTSAQKLALYHDDYAQTPNYGATALLIEYGFINNYRENQVWLERYADYAQAVGQGIASYFALE